MWLDPYKCFPQASSGNRNWRGSFTSEQQRFDRSRKSSRFGNISQGESYKSMRSPKIYSGVCQSEAPHVSNSFVEQSWRPSSMCYERGPLGEMTHSSHKKYLLDRIVLGMTETGVWFSSTTGLVRLI